MKIYSKLKIPKIFFDAKMILNRRIYRVKFSGSGHEPIFIEGWSCEDAMNIEMVSANVGKWSLSGCLLAWFFGRGCFVFANWDAGCKIKRPVELAG